MDTETFFQAVDGGIDNDSDKYEKWMVLQASDSGAYIVLVHQHMVVDKIIVRETHYRGTTPDYSVTYWGRDITTKGAPDKRQGWASQHVVSPAHQEDVNIIAWALGCRVNGVQPATGCPVFTVDLFVPGNGPVPSVTFSSVRIVEQIERVAAIIKGAA